MTLLSERLQRLRKKKDKTQEEVAKYIGVTRPAYSAYEAGKRAPDYNILQKLADFFNVTTDYLLGRTDDPTPPDKTPLISDAFTVDKFIEVPIYGQVAAGKPIFAEQNIEGYELVSADTIKGADYFFLRVKGDSMIEARIQEGDLVLVRKQDYLEDGEIGVIIVNQDEATIKRFYQQGDMAVLKAENPEHSPRVYPIENIKIIGEVVEAKIKFNGRK